MIGVDEVGRGCIAGPLVVVAARCSTELPSFVRDSKLLSRVRREQIFTLLESFCDYGEGWVSCPEIDKVGLADALRLGVKRALRNLNVNSSEKIIIDGPINYAPTKYKNVQALIDADDLVPLVSAASIIAKVKRDRYMQALAQEHPGYFFDTNVGYSTPQHLKALKKLGPVELIHCVSFAPLRQGSIW